MKHLAAAASLIAGLTLSTVAHAQTAPVPEPSPAPAVPSYPMTYAPAPVVGPRFGERLAYHGGPVPPGWELRTHRNRGLLLGGAITTAFFYGSVAVIGTSAGDAWFLVPVVTPIVRGGQWIADGWDHSDPRYTAVMTVYGVAMIADGILQGVAFGLLVAGVAGHTTELEFTGGMRGNRRERGVHWVVAPGAAGAAAGLTVAGAF